MIRRTAAKVDRNQVEITQALRKAGCQVLSLAPVGHGCADLLVSKTRHGPLFLLEVKDGTLSPSRRELTPLQVSFHARWPVAVVCSPEEALAAIGVQRKE